MKKYWFSVFILILLLSCNNGVVVNGDCLILPDKAFIIWPDNSNQPSEGDIIFYGELEGPGYWDPDFNPNNPDEFIYRTNNGLRKHVLSTGEDIVIYSYSQAGGIPYKAYWGNAGLIVFNAGLYKIYTVEPDGSNLTLRSATGSHCKVFWDYTGTKIIYSNAIDDMHTYIIDTVGNLLYTLPNGLYLDYLDWSLNSNTVLYPYGSFYGTFMQTDSLFTNLLQLIELPVSFNNSRKVQLTWINDHEVIWTSYHNLYKANIQTQQITLFKEGCSGKPYQAFAISPDKQKIIFATSRLRFEEPNRLISWQEMYIMNIDGTNEQLIPLPQ